MTASALYDGTIRHRRFAVRRVEFTHRLALAYIDLDELPRLLDGTLVRPRPGVLRFRRGDYLGDPAVSLAGAVRALVAQRTGRTPTGPIRLLAHLRAFGHCYNPVCLYYCHDRSGRLQALVAEVTNTPWGERHAYVLSAGKTDDVLDATVAKALHVSPFMGMAQSYRIRATTPARTLSVQIDSWEDDERTFDATLSLRRRPLCRRSLTEVTLRHPAASMRVLALIYGHALGLRLRGVPVHEHPDTAQ